MIELEYINWKVGTTLPEEVVRLLYSKDASKIQGIRDNFLSLTEKHVISPFSVFLDILIKEFEKVVNTAPPAENQFEKYDKLKDSYTDTWKELRRLDCKGQRKSDSILLNNIPTNFLTNLSLFTSTVLTTVII